METSSLYFRVLYGDFFSSERNPNPDHSSHARAQQFRFILLFLDLFQCGLGQQFQVFLLIPGGFELKDKTRQLLIHRLQLDIEASKPGFPIGADCIAVIENGTKPDHQFLVKRLGAGIICADGLQQVFFDALLQASCIFFKNCLLNFAK